MTDVTATRVLDGPRLGPARAPARQLVVLLHGYGADGNDLIALAGQIRALLPEAAFVAPHAPERCTMAGTGFQWFPLSRIDPQETLRGTEAAAPALDAFLDAELARLNVRAGNLALIGFSQGTMMALHVGLRRRDPPAAVIGFSGLLVAPQSVPLAESAPPPVLLVHGDTDPVIPAEALFVSASALGAAGVPVQWHLAPGIGHGIDPDGLALACRFLADAVRGRLRPECVPAFCRYPR